MHETRVAIAGLGAIGRTLARRLAAGLPGLALACAAAHDRAKAQAWLDAAGIECKLVALEEFPDYADLAVECAPAAVPENIGVQMFSRTAASKARPISSSTASRSPASTRQSWCF